MSDFQFEFDARPLQRVLSAVTDDMARGFQRAMSEVKRDVQKTNRAQFISAGQGDWRPITARSLAGRKVNTGPGAQNQPLIDTGELMASVTQDGAKHSILTLTPFELTLGTDRADAMRHNFGSADGSEPARQFLFLSDKEQTDIEKVFAEDMDVRVSRVVR